MTSLREKAKKIVKVWHTMTFTDIPEHERETLIQDITEALEAAYKQGAMARIELPEKDILVGWRRWDECLDAIKITPLAAEDILEPAKEFVGHWDIYFKTSIDCGQFYRDFRDFVSAKLEGLK